MLVDLTALGGSPSTTALDVKLQYSPDISGSRWFDLPSGAITQLTAVGSQLFTGVGLGVARRIKPVYTLAFTGGTAPTATFAVDIAFQQGGAGDIEIKNGAGNAIPMSIGNGSDVNAGATTDAAVTTSTTGTLSGKLRGLVTILSNVWDSVNGNLKTGLANALDEDIDSITSYAKGFTAVKLSADGIASASTCVFGGWYVESSSSGVISFYDNASAALGNTMGALSKSVAANDLVLFAQPVIMTNGVYFDLVSGSAAVYVLVRKITNQ
ncbi:hypothetical protein ACWFRF_15490 [Nocardia sp. NPDC055165]